MTEPDDTLQRLIALKRFEQPPEGFVDDFLVKFHERQRADLMKQSLRDLIMERIEGFFQRLSPPQLAMASVAVVLALVGVMSWLPSGTPGASVANAASRPDHHQPVVMNADLPPPDILNTSANFGSNPPPDEAAKLSPLLLSKHFVGGFADEARDAAEGQFVAGNHPPQFFIAMPTFPGIDQEPAPAADAVRTENAPPK